MVSGDVDTSSHVREDERRDDRAASRERWCAVPEHIRIYHCHVYQCGRYREWTRRESALVPLLTRARHMSRIVDTTHSPTLARTCNTPVMPVRNKTARVMRITTARDMQWWHWVHERKYKSSSRVGHGCTHIHLHPYLLYLPTIVGANRKSRSMVGTELGTRGVELVGMHDVLELPVQ
jgi:hypothetical protein